MFDFKKTAALAVLATGLTGAADAATVSWSALPETATLNPVASSTTGFAYQNVTSSNGIRRSVWKDVGTDIGALADAVGSYYSAVAFGGTATYDLGGTFSSLSFAWGSPDTHNLITFLLDGVVAGTFSLSATDVIAPATFGKGSAYATITGYTFDTVIFSASGIAFEYANLTADVVPVPLPAAGLALVGGLFGLRVLRRNGAKRA